MPKALLVDDDAGFVLGLAEAVKREGFEVRTAGNLQEARVALREQEPDALLSTCSCRTAPASSCCRRRKAGFRRGSSSSPATRASSWRSRRCGSGRRTS